ncbi:MAG TPA: hypothetical protein VFD58_17345 [Blastocatellia bacterium]|nr:hypothetical protein [Blastocatellia bacterium]
MKAARLIKRHEIQSRKPAGKKATAQHPAAAAGDKKSMMQWIREHQITRPANPREAFAALFAPAQNLQPQGSH